MTYSFSFTTPGTFLYYCTVHRESGMVGRVVVSGTSVPPGPGPAGNLALGKPVRASSAQAGNPPAHAVDGDLARAHNGLGEVVVRVRLSDTVRPGVASLPKGIWNRHTKNGVVGNALVPDAVSAISGGACFNDARVEVARA